MKIRIYSLVFKKLSMATYAVLIMPFGIILDGYKTKEEAKRISNIAQSLIDLL